MDGLQHAYEVGPIVPFSASKLERQWPVKHSLAAAEADVCGRKVLGNHEEVRQRQVTPQCGRGFLSCLYDGC